MTDETIDPIYKEVSEKMQKIHSLIQKLFPDYNIVIDSLNEEIGWEVRNKSDKWKS